MELYIIYGLLGRLLIFLGQKSPYQQIIGRLIGREWVRGFLTDLFSCDLCLGVWIYIFLSLIMKINMYSFYVPVLSEFLTGATMAFLGHLVAIGWREKFSTIIIQ